MIFENQMSRSEEILESGNEIGVSASELLETCAGEIEVFKSRSLALLKLLESRISRSAHASSFGETSCTTCVSTQRANLGSCTADHADHTGPPFVWYRQQYCLTSSGRVSDCKSNSKSSCQVSIGESCSILKHDVTQTHKI